MFVILVNLFDVLCILDPEILLAEDAHKNHCRQFQQTGKMLQKITLFVNAALYHIRYGVDQLV